MLTNCHLPQGILRIGQIICLLIVFAVDVSSSPKPLTLKKEGLVRDPKIKGVKALELWVDKPIALNAGSVQPGEYQCQFMVRFLGQPQVRFRYTLIAELDNEPIATRTFWTNAAPADGKYHPITVDFPVLKAGELTLRWSCKESIGEEDAKKLKEKRLKALAKEKVTSSLDEGDMDDLEAELEVFPLPKGTESMLIKSATIARSPSPLLITRVWPDKIHYYPEEEVTIDVDVINVTGKSVSGKLTVSLNSDLDNRKQLLQETIQVPAGGKVTRQVKTKPGKEYGYEILATIETPQGSHSKRDFFSISNNLFEVSIQGWGRVGVMNDQESLRRLLTIPEEKLDEISNQSAMKNRKNYYNHIEFFSWAPDDFFNLSPKGDAWWSGTMTYIKVKRDIKAEIKALQKQGIKVLSYAQPYAIGLDTVKELRTNPEFFAYSGSGSPSVSYDYDLIKSRARLDMGLRPTEIGGGLNFFNLATVDRGIDSVVASWKMFHWDGVRYDNRYYRANNPITFTGKRATEEKNLDPYSARNVKRQKSRFKKEIGPRFLISHNNGYIFHTENNKLGWEETIKGGLMCMDEETCNANSPGSRLNPYEKFFAFALEARRFCTKLGGYYQLFPPGRGQVPIGDMLYYAVACVATGSHPITCDVEGSPGGHFGRFMTRYASFIFARDLKPLEDPGTIIDFPGYTDKQLWWKPFARTRTDNGKEWLIFPLVIPPANPRINGNLESYIPLSQVLKGQLKLKADKGELKAFLLTPEKEDMATPVKLKPGQDGFTFELPRIHHLALLVIEKGGAK